MFDKMNALKAARDEYVAKLKAEGETAVKECLRGFFAAHPEVKALRWRQYTPYFNDGDECRFGIHEPEVRVGDGDWNDSWGLGYKNDNPPKQLQADLQEMYKALQGNRDAMEIAFGDHAQITATAESVTVEEYEHD